MVTGSRKTVSVLSALVLCLLNPKTFTGFCSQAPLRDKNVFKQNGHVGM